ncbi:MAG: HEAT repeat domain-containing protein [Phycisphaerales bacterium]|nr:HEAT repeat domain-containing protein [Phycisphaerales bacterium]
MSQPSEPCRQGVRGVGAILLAFVLAMTAVQGWFALRDRPNRSQRIAAIVVLWGVEAPGFNLPVSADEIDRRIAMLRSDDGEGRVRAAHWLAAHGVREAGAAIASAMRDPGTLRPCQLAHALGQLGDERWTDDLVRAAKQSWNRDLQLCATIGLQELAAERAVDALIDLAASGPARTIAIEALGVIGDPCALPALDQILKSTSDRHVKESAERAIERIGVLSMPDPVPDLVGRFNEALQARQLDEWALRCLARRGDRRAVPFLTNALRDDSLVERERESVAACLLVCGEPGRLALVRCSADETTRAGAVARSALDVLRHSDSPSTLRMAARPRAGE